MISESHSHIVIDTTNSSIQALKANPARYGLVLQNNGANKMYLAFGKPAQADATAFNISAGAMVFFDTFTPTREMFVNGTAGDALVIMEATDQ